MAMIQMKSPAIITPRLLPGVKVGDDAFISIEYDDITDDGRQRYQYHIDLPDFVYSANDLCSGRGRGGGTLQNGLESLLNFLSAAAESYSYEQRTGRESDNADLFPSQITKWAANNSDELSMLAYELEETKNLIQE